MKILKAVHQVKNQQSKITVVQSTSIQTLMRKSKLDSFLQVPSPLSHHSKTKARSAKVLTSQDYLEELE